MSAFEEVPPTASSTSRTKPPTLVFAAAVGIIVTNVFAPQTLVGPMGVSLGLGPATTGLAATATLLGYAFGLFLLVPLADLIENRALVTWMVGLGAVLAGTIALATAPAFLLAALFALGAVCSAIQVLVPAAASMVPPEQRGRMIGDVMAGLMVGILLSRPLASLVAGLWGWRAFYGLGATSLLLLTGVLATTLPRRRPATQEHYGALIASLGRLARTEPILRQRSLTAALVMAAFSLFWTAAGMRLAEPPFGLDQAGIALFALVGAGGALATPVFGRLGDRGLTRSGLVGADLVLIVALALAGWAGLDPSREPLSGLALLAAGAFLLDIGVTGDQTLGRRAINLLSPEARGRLNGLFVGTFFLGGSIGSALAGPAESWGGWGAVCGLAAAFASAALALNVFGPTPTS